jgi:hypothetical protein
LRAWGHGGGEAWKYGSGEAGKVRSIKTNLILKGLPYNNPGRIPGKASTTKNK